MYEPTGPEVPAGGDGRLAEGGSFEMGPNAWDNCAARIPGMRRVQGDAADGEYFFTLELPPADFEPRDDGSDAQIAFYLTQSLPADVALYLYFDAKNLSLRPPLGEFHIAATETFCHTLDPLATIAFADLALTNEWETRCVELRPTLEVSVLGLWGRGTDYFVGVDAFRFGPPCH